MARSELDHVHLVISLLKRWLGGTHQGAVTPSHLQAYLDEFAFRFNRRLSHHRGKLFYRLMQQAVTARPPPVKALYVSKSRPMGSLESINHPEKFYDMARGRLRVLWKTSEVPLVLVA